SSCSGSSARSRRIGILEPATQRWAVAVAAASRCRVIRRWNRASTTDRTIRRTCGGSLDSGLGEKSMTRWTLRGYSAIALIAAATHTAVGQQPGATGTVVGQIVATESKAPLSGAQVTVLGTTLRAVANIEGRFVVRNVPAGAQTVRVQMLGFAPTEQ